MGRYSKEGLGGSRRDGRHRGRIGGSLEETRYSSKVIVMKTMSLVCSPGQNFLLTVFLPDTDEIPDSNGNFNRRGTAVQIFGLPLEDAVKLSRISVVTGVPAVVTRCIEYLDIMGVEEVGLYRVSGSTSNVARLRSMFDHGKPMAPLGQDWSKRDYGALIVLRLHFRPRL